MNKLQILVILVGVAFATVIFVPIIQGSGKITGITTGTHSTSPIIDDYWNSTTRIDLTQSSTLAGFNVKIPSKIPTNYTLQISSIKKIENYTEVYLFYSKVPITENMTLDNFFGSGGFWITYNNGPYEEGNNASTNKWMSDSLALYRTGWKYDVLVTSINGYPAISFDQNYRDGGGGQKIHDTSLVDFITKDARISLQGYLPKEELIQIAQSIK